VRLVTRGTHLLSFLFLIFFKFKYDFNLYNHNIFFKPYNLLGSEGFIECAFFMILNLNSSETNLFVGLVYVNKSVQI
jgi:hypothetical protein